MRKAFRLYVAGLCAFVLLVSGMALAQEEPLGPFEFAVDLGAEWTDNRDSTPEEEDNIDLFVRATVKSVLERDRSLLELFYSPCFRYRDDPSEIQNDTELLHDLGVRLIHRMSERIKLWAKDDLNYTDDPSVTEGGTTLRRDSSFLLNRSGAGVSWDVTRKAVSDLNLAHMIKRYDEKYVGDRYDEESLGMEGFVGRRLSRTLTVGGLVEVTQFDYERSVDLDRGFTSMSAGLRVDKQHSTQLKTRLRAGWTDLDYEDSAIDSESAPFVDVSVDARTIPQTRITAAARYLLRDSDVFPFSSQEHTDFSAKVEHKASERVVLCLAGAYRIGSYDVDTIPTPLWVLGADEATIDRTTGDETTIILEAEAVYKIGLNTSLKLVQRFEDVDSDAEELRPSFTRNATRLVLSQTF